MWTVYQSAKPGNSLAAHKRSRDAPKKAAPAAAKRRFFLLSVLMMSPPDVVLPSIIRELPLLFPWIFPAKYENFMTISENPLHFRNFSYKLMLVNIRNGYRKGS